MPLNSQISWYHFNLWNSSNLSTQKAITHRCGKTGPPIDHMYLTAFAALKFTDRFTITKLTTDGKRPVTVTLTMMLQS